VHSRLGNVIDMGTDPEEPQGGVVLPDCADKKSLKHNIEFCSGVSGLPEVFDMMAFGSLEHGHFNYVLRCIVDQVASDCSRISTDGKLDAERVRACDAALARIRSTGLRFKVLDPCMRVEQPDGAKIISEAPNANQSLGMR
jgi:hypothetical protein